jgi:hypothetical protein
MSDVLKQIYNACDPLEAASAEYYLDCSAARGSSALTREFQRHLDLATDYRCFLFSGHSGCGKSSELRQLQHELAHPVSPNKRYFPILLDVHDYLDEYDAAPIDILLAIVSEVAAELRQVGRELKDNYFVKRLNEIRQYFLSEAEINEGDLSLSGAKLKILRLKRDPTARQRVREALEDQLSTMLEEIGTVFDEARLELQRIKPKAGEQRYTDTVLILDNLEKIERVSDRKKGLEAQRELFIEGAPQLTGLKTHVIYTVPLRLVRSDGPQLQQRYGRAPFVLPMIKVSERGTRPPKPFQQGIDCLRALLQRRLSGHSLAEIFNEDALGFLLRYSGGNVRTLMAFVQRTCIYNTTLPLSLDAAHYAIQETVRIFSTSIPESHWAKLAELDRSPDQMIPGGDDDYLLMLDQLSVLEYINGGVQNSFDAAEPWYAVHPIVRELRKFKTASDALSKVAR